VAIALRYLYLKIFWFTGTAFVPTAATSNSTSTGLRTGGRQAWSLQAWFWHW